jgi:Tfp pilus assembly PilM family ATPase
MAKNKSCVNGIDISNENIVVAQYSLDEDSIINTGIILNPLEDVESNSKQDLAIGTKLKKISAQMKCSGQKTAVSLPFNYAVVKNFMVDSDEKNIKSVLEWELSQNIVGNIDDYYFDYEPIGSTPQVAKYLVAAYRKNKVQKIVSLIKSAGFNPFIVDLDMFALVNVFEKNYKENISEACILLYADTRSSKIIFTKDGTFIDFELVENFQFAENAETYAKHILEIINKSLEKEDLKTTIFLTGGLFSNFDFLDKVCSILGNAKLLNPLKEIKNQIDISPQDLQKCLPYLSVAVGLAIRAGLEATL